MLTDIPPIAKRKLVTRHHLSHLPSNSGVYFLFSKKGELLYIGKAIHLKRRVKSYFTPNSKLNPKTKALIDKIHYFAYTVTFNDLAALLLESHLIAQHKPLYNISSREKIHPTHIAIIKSYPSRVYLTRYPAKPKTEKYYGPFYSAKKAQYILKKLRPVIKFRSCQRLPKSSCLYFELGLCSAPCIHKISKTEYQKSTHNLHSLLAGQYSKVLQSLKKHMDTHTKTHEYEKSAEIRDIIDSLSASNYLPASRLHIFESSLLKLHLKSEHLSDLNFMLSSHFPKLALTNTSRLEGYDISHLSSQDVSGSMIVFIGAKTDSASYRRFRLSSSHNHPDDSSRLYSILDRRLHHTKWPLPSLILIDGGKPQVSLALQALKKHNLTIPLVGLAKKRETLVVTIDGGYKYLSFKPSRPGMLLLRHVRDESHRFAKNYHLKLRQKSIGL